MKRDCLGRPIHDDGSEKEPPRPRFLTDDQITAIAQDVRTRPITEVGRHVMPLIQHIVELDARECHNCVCWVGYADTETRAHHGECTNLTVRDRIQTITSEGEQADVHSAFITPFDWSCKDWTEQPPESSDAPKCQRA